MALRLLQRLEPLLASLLVAGVACLAVLGAYFLAPAVPVAAALALVAVALAFIRPLWVAYAGAAALPLDLLSLPLGSFALAPAECLFALAGAGWALRRLASGRAPFVRHPVSLALAALIATVLLGLLNAEDGFQVLKRLVMWSGFFLMFNMVLAEGRRSAALILLGVLATAGALEGVLSIGTASGALQVGGDSSTDRVRGSFDHPNTLGLFMAMALPAAVAVALQARVLLRALAIGAAALIIAGLVLSLSRGGIVAATGALAVSFAFLPRFRRIAIVAGAIGLVVAGLAAAGVVGGSERTEPIAALQERFTGGPSESAEPDARVQIWARTPEMIGDHLLTGVGAYNFREFAPRYGIINLETHRPFSHAHNVPLTVLAEMGVIGFSAFVLFLLTVARSLWPAVQRGLGGDRAYGVAVAGVVVAVGLAGVFDDTIGANSFAGLTLALVGAGVALGLPGSRPAAASEP